MEQVVRFLNGVMDLSLIMVAAVTIKDLFLS